MSLKLVTTALLLISMQLGAFAGRNRGPGDAVWATDPVFGLEFHPSTVKYEPLPARMLRTCGEFAPGQYWIFAHLRRNDGDYFVVLDVYPSSKRGGDALGAAIAITGSKCQAEDSLSMFLAVVPAEGYPSQIREPARLPGLNAKWICNAQGDCYYVLQTAEEEAILRGLVQDALVRGIRAWGGVANFRQAACRADMIEGNANTPIIQQELSNFCQRTRGLASPPGPPGTDTSPKR